MAAVPTPDERADVYLFVIVCLGLVVGEAWRVTDGISRPEAYAQFLIDYLPHEIVPEPLLNLFQMMLNLHPTNRPKCTTIAAKLE
jgi:hypothetical protein